MSAVPRIAKVSAAVVVTAITLVALSHDLAMGVDLIDRRHQAQRAFLASPGAIYLHYCSACHGADGKGGGRFWATELSPGPSDLTALGTDKAYLVEAISKGSQAHGKSNLCPPWGRTIPPDKIERLAQYVLAFGERSPQPSGTEAPTSGPVREASSWPLIGVILAEGAILGWMLLNRKRAKKNS